MLYGAKSTLNITTNVPKREGEIKKNQELFLRADELRFKSETMLVKMRGSLLRATHIQYIQIYADYFEKLTKMAGRLDSIK